MRQIRDAWFRKAKREGKLARSVYKLEQINRRFRLFGAGHRVLDLGSCPGSWLEYILETVGPSGLACAVDTQPIDRRFKGRAHFIRGDLNALPVDAFDHLTDRFQAVVSDMAPATSGIKAVDQARSLALCELALDWAEKRLSRNGNFVGKLFDGPEAESLRRRLASLFREIHMVKPAACRRESFEFYLVGRHRI